MHFIGTRAGIAVMAGIAAVWLSIVFGTQQSMSGSPSGATFYFAFAGVAALVAIITAIVLMVRDSDTDMEVTPLSVPSSPEVVRMSGPPLVDGDDVLLSNGEFYDDLVANVPGFQDTRQSGEPA